MPPADLSDRGHKKHQRFKVKSISNISCGYIDIHCNFKLGAVETLNSYNKMWWQNTNATGGNKVQKSYFKRIGQDHCSWWHERVLWLEYECQMWSIYLLWFKNYSQCYSFWHRTKTNAPKLHSWGKKKEKSIHNMQYCTCEYQFQLYVSFFLNIFYFLLNRNGIGLKFNNIINALSLQRYNIQNEHSQKWQA